MIEPMIDLILGWFEFWGIVRATVWSLFPYLVLAGVVIWVVFEVIIKLLQYITDWQEKRRK